MAFNYEKMISEAHLSSAGWGIDEFNHSSPFECHVIYVHDYRRKYTQLFTIKKADFEALNLPENFTSRIYATLIAELMIKAKRGTLNQDERDSLGPALAGYTRSTDTYRSWRKLAEPADRLHMVINIYQNYGLLRPFIVRSANTVLTIGQVLTLSQQVKTLDLVKNPNWFSSKE